MKHELEKHLEKIGWKLKYCGVEHYALVDHEKEVTEFHLYKNELTVGDRRKSIIMFNLSECEIVTDKDCDCVTIKATEEIFIQLYNFSK